MAKFATGYLGGLLEKMSGFAFWLMHSGLVATGAVAMRVFALLFRRILAPTAEPAPIQERCFATVEERP
ncbi:MAG TPA: hypothetical protein VMT11_07140 [Myxococcaceae bacterium]|nr:hypothetical protein [Myxococcaceae bacterium]